MAWRSRVIPHSARALALSASDFLTLCAPTLALTLPPPPPLVALCVSPQVVAYSFYREPHAAPVESPPSPPWLPCVCVPPQVVAYSSTKNLRLHAHALLVQLLRGFSGQCLYDDWVQSAFNVLFTAPARRSLSWGSSTRNASLAHQPSQPGTPATPGAPALHTQERQVHQPGTEGVGLPTRTIVVVIFSASTQGTLVCPGCCPCRTWTGSGQSCIRSCTVTASATASSRGAASASGCASRCTSPSSSTSSRSTRPRGRAHRAHLRPVDVGTVPAQPLVLCYVVCPTGAAAVCLQ